ncbi:hypothetical protein [Nocardia seriolae]|nr:hypothetical protein [Nocardia seriolae]
MHVGSVWTMAFALAGALVLAVTLRPAAPEAEVSERPATRPAPRADDAPQPVH